MLKGILIFTICFMTSACVAPVKLAITVDQSCVVPKIALEQETLRFFNRLFDDKGEPVEITVRLPDGRTYTTTVPRELAEDIGEIRKQSKSHDALCRGPLQTKGAVQ